MKKRTKLFWMYSAVTTLVLIVGLATAMAQTGVLFVANDKVGIGIASPLAPLHIQVAAGEPNIRLETLASAAVRFELLNSAGEWEFIHGAGGAFNFNRVGIAGTQFIFTPGGNLHVQGDGNFGGVVNTGSSRAWKQDFDVIESQEVLGKVADLPLSSWRYKTGGGSHFGPMAEDFHAAFGFGTDERYLAPGDMAGVALAAVQGLNETIIEKDERISALERKLAELQVTVAKLAELENQ